MNKIQSKHEPNSPKARKLSACEVEKKLNDIMATVDNEADLQNKLLFLLDDIGLPKDSADQYSRRLSYSEAYERIMEWIREANAQRRVKIMVWTACISAASALIASLTRRIPPIPVCTINVRLGSGPSNSTLPA